MVFFIFEMIQNFKDKDLHQNAALKDNNWKKVDQYRSYLFLLFL